MGAAEAGGDGLSACLLADCEGWDHVLLRFTGTGPARPAAPCWEATEELLERGDADFFFLHKLKVCSDCAYQPTSSPWCSLPL